MSDPTPLPMRRLPKQPLHHVWAPKLARPVVLNTFVLRGHTSTA